MNNYAHRVSLVGITGYAGQELVRLLESHPKIAIEGRFASKAVPDAGIDAFTVESVTAHSPDVVVLATEHELSMQVVPEFLSAGYRVVDMSGAFRMKDPQLYPQWYGFEHSAPSLLNEAVYGLPEYFSDSIRKARLVANPGCYATAAILPLAPLYKAKAIDPESVVVVDGKSGVSGAGRAPKQHTHFSEVTENLSAYGVLAHRHTPEMISYIPGATFDKFVFTPHLMPINRGILNTIVVRTPDRVSIRSILAETYALAPFVRILPEGQLPNIHAVVRTNFCLIGVVTRGSNTVIVSAIDNLTKGASGQALQNLNLMLGYDQTLGLVQ
jgi:N-acetyl-gamma-glutamyl-phosphate reductase